MGQHLTKSQRENLKSLVLEAQLKRLNTDEALFYIREKLKVPISESHYFLIKRKLKEDTGKRLNSLMKDRYAYAQQTFERIDELKSYQKDLQEMIRTYNHNPILKKNCYSELHSLTLSINSLYELLPDLVVLQTTFNETYGESPQLEKESKEETESEPQPDDTERKF